MPHMWGGRLVPWRARPSGWAWDGDGGGWETQALSCTEGAEGHYCVGSSLTRLLVTRGLGTDSGDPTAQATMVLQRAPILVRPAWATPSSPMTNDHTHVQDGSRRW